MIVKGSDTLGPNAWLPGTHDTTCLTCILVVAHHGAGCRVMGPVERGQDGSVHGGRGGSVQPDVSVGWAWSVDSECGTRVPSIFSSLTVADEHPSSLIDVSDCRDSGGLSGVGLHPMELYSTGCTRWGLLYIVLPSPWVYDGRTVSFRSGNPIFRLGQLWR